RVVQVSNAMKSKPSSVVIRRKIEVAPKLLSIGRCPSRIEEFLRRGSRVSWLNFCVRLVSNQQDAAIQRSSPKEIRNLGSGRHAGAISTTTVIPVWLVEVAPEIPKRSRPAEKRCLV